MDDFFDSPPMGELSRRPLAEGAVVLSNRLLTPQRLGARHGETWGALLAPLLAVSPWRRMKTPGGHPMSVQMTNCGQYGWVSDRAGYRYQTTDPQTKAPWPDMPPPWREQAQAWAVEAGYGAFTPDACLINRYGLGAKMSLHQDRDENDMSQPIVSLSLGMSAIFLFGGQSRSAAVQRVVLSHGDVVVWGGPSRLFFHGIAPLKGCPHGDLGSCRLNLTFRRARS